MPETTPDYIIMGNGDIIWGADIANVQFGGAAQAIGYIQGGNSGSQMDRKQIKDGKGVVRADVLYNENGDLDADFVLFTGAVLPEKGSTFGMDGRVGHLISARKTFANEDAVKYSVQGAWYAGITYSET